MLQKFTGWPSSTNVQNVHPATWCNTHHHYQCH